MKVLFVGGTGNISNEVSKCCVKNNIDLFLLNRGIRKIEGTEQIIGDISDKNTFEEELNKHNWDAVVNWIAFNKNCAVISPYRCPSEIRIFFYSCILY